MMGFAWFDNPKFSFYFCSKLNNFLALNLESNVAPSSSYYLGLRVKNNLNRFNKVGEYI